MGGFYKEYNPSSVSGFSEILYLLKRILEQFRKHGKGEFAKQSEFIDNEIIKNIPIRLNLLSYLMELGIIKKGNDIKYYMMEEVSMKHGISWSNIKSLNFNDDLMQFLHGFKHKYPTDPFNL